MKTLIEIKEMKFTKKKLRNEALAFSEKRRVFDEDDGRMLTPRH